MAATSAAMTLEKMCLSKERKYGRANPWLANIANNFLISFCWSQKTSKHGAFLAQISVIVKNRP
jgi:hypothetical protein